MCASGKQKHSENMTFTIFAIILMNELLLKNVPRWRPGKKSNMQSKTYFIRYLMPLNGDFQLNED